MQTFTHFRCAFDVSPAGAIERPWAALVGEVRAWIAQKERQDFKGWFYGGGTWSGDGPQRPRVQSKALSDGGDTPQMWAVRYEHGDSTVRARRWATDVAVTEIGAREWRIAVTLRHWLRPDYVGAEPRAPEPSSPRIVKALTQGGRWHCRVGEVCIHARPTTLMVGKADQFVRMLLDRQRLVPVLLASCSREGGTPLIDTVGLSQALAGTAAVYVCESPECDDELEHFLPFRFRSPNGTVRIYAPGVEIEQDWSASRHRFFSPRDIESLGEEEVVRQIIRALTRSDAWRGLRSAVSSIDDIDIRLRERRLNELRASSRTDAQREELLALFEQTNVELDRENKQLALTLESEREDRARLEDQLALREYDAERLQALADEARETARARDTALATVLSLTEWPTSAHEVATLVVALHEDRITLLESGRRSLEKSEFAKASSACSIVWNCLRAIATHLHELVMTDLPAQTVADLFRARSGFELAWTETKQTNRDGKLMALRRVSYNGAEVDITPHVKWGNRSLGWLRVHFYVDKANNRVVIGHCGDHLDTFGTRRRGQ